LSNRALLVTYSKVGEAIEEALQRMMCPYPLQAHQIQGLDYPAVLLVVQWLVKRVLQNREESGDQVNQSGVLVVEVLYLHASQSTCEDSEPERQQSIAATV
jgi:hypothetical protein